MSETLKLSQQLKILRREMQIAADDKRHLYLPLLDLNHLIRNLGLMAEMAICLEELQAVANERARHRGLIAKMTATTAEVLDCFRNKPADCIQLPSQPSNVIAMPKRHQSNTPHQTDPTGGSAA